MIGLRASHVYRDVILYDRESLPCLATDSATSEAGTHARGLMTHGFRTGQAELSDIHRAPHLAVTHLDLLAPVIAPSRDGTAGRPIAMFMLRIAMEDFLDPLIQTWPTPSRTAESLLVRREGNEMVYLNELRYRYGAALALKVPVDVPSAPPRVQAAGKRESSTGGTIGVSACWPVRNMSPIHRGH